ncbi:UDP-n-acetylglucosamine--n-acetylmuramyl-(pentapeptide) pyrophosphoryl-undecaprenol n-acetylglucosamine transferase [Plakobranchus ocellatus]|uniref:UDP-n-acetylglucosamine--n-acetylmuramyl-(Pentapeptide) pyrophosphoryl-undecaprenol n-acetylglucosamine transferase n=1 Tax=Plakobranchus ocellatus TaxID=259542 RepID=A0AAV4BZ38_9GAST|nr:UDP-n-acetylglucosamine--n-acetylmuramyl-(pentapeptide) pyrophosphoryl-undecaprenol n-acetylglucosamine transferase [Plakobranchus ocellatus]
MHCNFADYVLKHYIAEFPEFPPQIWTATDETDEGQMTNACETFHSHFADNFTCPHPNIFVLIEALTKKQKRSQLKLNSISNPFAKRKAFLQKESEKIKIKEQYSLGDMTQL